MKTLLLLILLIVFAFSSFSQPVSADIKTKEYYLTKSKHQKTIAWIMAGGGAALAGVGFALVNTETIDYSLGADNKNGAGAVVAIVGIASALGSIPVFISAAHNKRKAAEVAFDMQPIPQLQVASSSIILQPSVVLKIKL